MKKRILILAYDFPPYVSVGGLRPFAWYKYLDGYDVYPIIVTRQWQNRHKNHLDYISPGESNKVLIEKSETGTIIRSPYKPNIANKMYLRFGENKFAFVRKIFSAFYELGQYIFPIGPKFELYKAAEDFLKKETVDVIMATGDPFILFRYASRLSDKYNIPWIADYRDPWSQDMGLTNRPFWKNFYTRQENKYLANVRHIITVSDFVKSQIPYATNAENISIIPNGYDPETVAGIDLTKQNTETFSIALAGSIFNWHPYHSFLKVFTHFIKSTSNVKCMLNLYGVNIADELRETIANEFPEIKAHVNFHPRMANDLLMPLMAQNNAFLLFNYYSYMGTKIYDYLALKRNIILCYSNDSGALELKKSHFAVEETNSYSGRLQEDLITQTQSGYVVENEQHLAELLPKLYGEFVLEGKLRFSTSVADAFSRKEQTGQLAKIIHSL